MMDLAFRSSQAANVTTVVRGGVSADDSIATLELAIDKVRFLKTHSMFWYKIVHQPNNLSSMWPQAIFERETCRGME